MIVDLTYTKRPTSSLLSSEPWIVQCANVTLHRSIINGTLSIREEEQQDFIQ